MPLELTRPQLELLTKFAKGVQIDDAEYYKFWNPALGEKFEKTVTRFEKNCLIIEADLVKKIEHSCMVVDLTKFLAKKGQKVSGKKFELAERVSVFTEDKFVIEIAKQKIYDLTETGNRLANAYLAFKKNERNEAEVETMRLLQARKLPEALMVMAAFEAKQVFERGIGTDWKNYVVDKNNPDLISLEQIYSRKPKILKDIPDNKYEHFRLAGAMEYMWGTSDGTRWLPGDFKTTLHFNNKVAIRMVAFFGIHQRELILYQNWSLPLAGVMVGGAEECCEECKKIHGKIFTFNKVFELPYEKCTNPIGCRCGYGVHDKRGNTMYKD